MTNQGDAVNTSWSSKNMSRLLWPLVMLQITLLPASASEITLDLTRMSEYDGSDDPGAPVGAVWHNGTYMYMPAPPGQSPSCALEGGLTYCPDITNYPDDLIKRLLVELSVNLSTIFLSETDDTLVTKGPKTALPPLPATAFGPLIPVFGDAGETRIPSRPVSKARGRRPGGKVNLLTPGYPPAQQGPIFGPVGGFRYLPPDQKPQERTQTGYSYSVPRNKRQADSAAGAQLCPTAGVYSLGQFVKPRAGLNSRGEWRYVINVGDLDPHYTQLVRAERCVTERCNGLCTIPAGMTATCRQQYVQKKMVGLDPTGTQVYTDLYWIPNCCVCQIQ